MNEFTLNKNELESKYKLQNKTFHFAKVNINGNIFSANNEELYNLIQIEIPFLIKNSPEITVRSGGTYSFADVLEIEHNNSYIILGNLTYSADKEPRYLDKENRTTESTQVKNHASSATFLYDINSEILAYSTSNAIKTDVFKTRFKQLLETNDKIGSIKIIDYAKEHNIFEVFRSLKKITCIKFSIIPPNPTPLNRKKFKSIIKDMHAKELEIVLKDPDGNLRIAEDNVTEIKNEQDLVPTIAEGIEYVEQGYGSVKIQGQNKFNKKIEFSSNENTEKTTLNGKDNFEALEKGLSFLLKLIQKKTQK